jgi:hypothetical protein
VRKLREYKGIKYLQSIGCFQHEGQSYKSAAYLVTHLPFLDDDDHAELMRLKAEPYEPVPRLEDVVYGWLKEEIECRTGTFPPINHWRLIDRLRAAFPHIDQEER